MSDRMLQFSGDDILDQIKSNLMSLENETSRIANEEINQTK